MLQNLTLEDVERDTDDAGEKTITELVTFDGLHLTVTGSERDDTTWISIAAREADAQQGDQAAAATEARTLNERLSGWRYRIPSYKFEQLTRRMDDLLQAET